jgi:predicted dehydrogenase
MRNREDFQVVAVADSNRERQQQAQEELGAEAFNDISSLLKGSDAELIVVATASSDHANHSIQALEAGRHVLTEKPMATSVEDADRMLAAAETSGKILTIHQSARWSPVFAFIKQMLSDERLGRVFFIRSGGYGYTYLTVRKRILVGVPRISAELERREIAHISHTSVNRMFHHYHLPTKIYHFWNNF